MNMPWSVCCHCHSLVLTGVKKKKHQKHKPWGFIMTLETQNTFSFVIIVVFKCH